MKKIRKRLIKENSMKDLHQDLINLQKCLREIHTEGIDLYTKNNYNFGEKNWLNKVPEYDSSKSYSKKEMEKLKKKAAEQYNKELEQKLDSKLQQCTKKGRTFG